MVALDERWFNAFKAISSTEPDLEWLQAFMRVSAAEHVRFLHDETENPRFQYLKNRTREEESLYEQYVSLRDVIDREERNETIRGLYIKKIEAQLNRLDMIKATIAGDDESVHALSKKIYGQPKKSHFSMVAERVMMLCKAAGDAEQSEAAKRLKKVFSKIDTSKVVLTHDVLPPPVEVSGAPVTAKEAAAVFQSVLERCGITDWSVKIDEEGNRTRFSVSVSRKVINVPSDSQLKHRARPLTRLGAEALAEHEVGVHVRRAFEGERQPLRLLSIGLRGYLRGEEGLASYVQQQIEGANEYYGFDRYLAISLAMGLDGTPRDFRSVFCLMFDYYTLTTPKSVRSHAALEHAAWEVCLRIFRGTTGGAKGLVYTRDHVYFEGNVGVWKLLIDRPQVFEQLFIGKFDPLSKSHISALQSLEIISEW